MDKRFFMATSVPKCLLTSDRRNEMDNVIQNYVAEHARLPLNNFGLVDKIEGELKDRLTDAMLWYQGLDDRYDVGVMRWEGMDFDVYVTGGVTSDDDPTDSYEHIRLLNNCGLVRRKLLEWARADFAMKKHDT